MIFDVLGEVFVHRHELRHALFVALCTDAAEHHVDPTAETVCVGQWQANHLCNDEHWNVLCVLHSGVDHVGVTHVVDEFVTNLFDF